MRIAPQVYTPKILESDPAQAKEEEVLYLDDRLQRAMPASRYLLFPKNSSGFVMVGEGFRDRFFLRGMGGEMPQYSVC